MAGSASRSWHSPSISYLLGFQTKYIWNPWGIPLHTAHVPSMFLLVLFDSSLAYCDKRPYEKSQIFIKSDASTNLWWADKIRAFFNLEADFQVEIFTLSSWKWFLRKNIKLDAQLLLKGFVILQHFIKLYLAKLCLNFAGLPQVCTYTYLDEELEFFIF